MSTSLSPLRQRLHRANNRVAKVVALDYGDVRVGVALASLDARLPHPYATLSNDGHLMERLATLVDQEEVTTIVVGLPRSLSGGDTAQTAKARAFAASLHSLGVSIVLQDEALTSDLARQELEARRKPYSKGDIDALAACYILEDYMGVPKQ